MSHIFLDLSAHPEIVATWAALPLPCKGLTIAKAFCQSDESPLGHYESRIFVKLGNDGVGPMIVQDDVGTGKGRGGGWGPNLFAYYRTTVGISPCCNSVPM
jgi:hypothetical protein